MKLVKAGFDLLYFFSSCDKNIQREELEVIKNYLIKNFKEDFNPAEEIRRLCALDHEAKVAHLSEVADYINEHTNQESKENLLTFALRLITVDGKATNKELELFSIVCSIWDIDKDTFLKNYSL